MMMNKLDFENGLQVDKQLVGGGGVSNNLLLNQAPGSKPNLFSPNPNLMGGGMPLQNQFSNNQDLQCKNKRDLLWEQKRKQKLDLVNPPILKEGGGAFIDMMAPKQFPPKEQQFQKATIFEQPMTLIEIQPSPLIIQQQKPQQTPQQQLPIKQQSLPIQEVDSFYPPQQQQKPSTQDNAWQQMQQNQYREEFYQMPQQQIPSSSQQQFQQYPAQTPPQQYMEQDFYQPQQYQPQQQQQQYQVSTPQQQPNQPASQPSYSAQPRVESSSQQRQAQQQQNALQQQHQVNKQQEQKLKQQEYLMILQNDVREKEERKKREKEERIRKEKEELKKNLEYNPFGKAGAGAPLKDHQGNIVVTRKQNIDQQQPMRAQQKPPTPIGNNGYQQQFLPQQNQVGPANVYYNQQMNDFQQPQQMGIQQQYNISPPPQQNIMQQQFQRGGLDFVGLPPANMMNNNNFGGGMPMQMQMPIGMGQQMPMPQMQQFNDFDFPQQIQPVIQQKIVAPSPSIMPPVKMDQFQYDPASQNVLGIGAYNDNETNRQKAQKQELQNVLKQQMLEQNQKKEELKRLKLLEERLEEERIKKERKDIDDQFKQEEEKKKAKSKEFQQANAQMVSAKGGQAKTSNEESSFQNYVVDKKGSKPDIFGNNNQNSVNINQEREAINQSYDQGQTPPPNQSFKRQTTFEGGPPNPQISQTRIINDISAELKNNLKEELDKLRNEMGSQQRVLREQMERLKIDQTQKVEYRHQEQRQEGLEILKLEVQKQREQERAAQQKLITALERHNPNKPIAPIELLHNYDKAGAYPGQSNNNANIATYGTPGQPQFNVAQYQPNNSFYKNGSRGGGSRQESRDSQRKKELNNYEKMFLNNNQTKPQQKSMSQQREEPIKGPPPQYNIKEEKMVRFNQDYFQPPQQQNDYYQNNQYDYQPKIVKRDDSNINNSLMKSMLGGESTLLPITYQDSQDQQQEMAMVCGYGSNKNQSNRQEVNFDYNKENSQFNKQTAGGNSYFDHIKSVGGGAQNVYLGTDGSENTMEFVNKIVNGKDESAEKMFGQKDPRFADKVDDFNFNFPQLPQYDGFQVDYIKKQQAQDPYQNNVTRQDSFAKMGGGFHQGGGAEGTLNSMGTLNSINLDHLNKKYEDRLAKYGGVSASDSIDYTQNKNYSQNQQYQMPSQQQRQPPPKAQDSNDELKQLDNLLFDLLRSNEPAGGGPSSYNQRSSMNGGQNKIVHINQSNNADNMAKMRGTREQFMAPKLGLIDEDGGEDYDGTFKQYKGIQGGEDFKMPSDMRRYDSMLDTTNLAMD